MLTIPRAGNLPIRSQMSVYSLRNHPEAKYWKQWFRYWYQKGNQFQANAKREHWLPGWKNQKQSEPILERVQFGLQKLQLEIAHLWLHHLPVRAREQPEHDCPTTWLRRNSPIICLNGIEFESSILFWPNAILSKQEW